MSVCPTVTESPHTHSQGSCQLERQGLHKMFRLNSIPPAAPAPTPTDMDATLRTMASRKLIQAYAAIPETLSSMFPTNEQFPTLQVPRLDIIEPVSGMMLDSSTLPLQPTQVTDTS